VLDPSYLAQTSRGALPLPDIVFLCASDHSRTARPPLQCAGMAANKVTAVRTRLDRQSTATNFFEAAGWRTRRLFSIVQSETGGRRRRRGWQPVRIPP